MSEIDKIQNKIEIISQSLQNIDKTLAVNTALLDEHIKRTELLETRMQKVDTHVNMVNGIVKFILALAATKALWTMLAK